MICGLELRSISWFDLSRVSRKRIPFGELSSPFLFPLRPGLRCVLYVLFVTLPRSSLVACPDCCLPFDYLFLCAGFAACFPVGACTQGLSSIVCIACGMLTSTFGGVIRDVLCSVRVRASARASTPKQT